MRTRNSARESNINSASVRHLKTEKPIDFVVLQGPSELISQTELDSTKKKNDARDNFLKAKATKIVASYDFSKQLSRRKQLRKRFRQEDNIISPNRKLRDRSAR